MGVHYRNIVGLLQTRIYHYLSGDQETEHDAVDNARKHKCSREYVRRLNERKCSIDKVKRLQGCIGI